MNFSLTLLQISSWANFNWHPGRILLLKHHKLHTRCCFRPRPLTSDSFHLHITFSLVLTDSLKFPEETQIRGLGITSGFLSSCMPWLLSSLVVFMSTFQNTGLIFFKHKDYYGVRNWGLWHGDRPSWRAWGRWRVPSLGTLLTGTDDWGTVTLDITSVTFFLPAFIILK